MTNYEFSNEFDILYNNISSNQAPGLDEYEKSVFLTKAQEEILKNHFTSRTDAKGNETTLGFDDTAKRQIDFSNSLVVYETQQFYQESDPKWLVSQKHCDVLVPEDVMMVLNEFIQVTRNNVNRQLSVIPIKYTDFSLKSSKPYAYPLKNQAWRLLIGTFDLAKKIKKKATIIVGPFDTPVSYVLRYIKKPNPIVLVNLPDGLSINNISVATECELDPILHQEILQRAVELAKVYYGSDPNQNTQIIQTGQRSE